MNEFRNFMTPCRKGHLIGIGGVSMMSPSISVNIRYTDYSCEPGKMASFAAADIYIM